MVKTREEKIKDKTEERKKHENDRSVYTPEQKWLAELEVRIEELEEANK